MTTPACAPHRSARESSLLQRSTCLTAEEERKLNLRATDGGSTRARSDRVLGKSIGENDVVRPAMPDEWAKDPKTWLSNVDIDAVMQQYARVTKKFVYMGTWPTDFAERIKDSGKCVRMCSPQPVSEAFRRKALAACVVNLDVHTGSGTHWVAIAIDCRQGGVPKLFFYDPTGRPPPRRWMKKSAWAVITSGVPGSTTRRKMLHSAVYNCAAHQRQDTECGIFSMMCIDALISGRTFEEHCRNALSDEDAFRHRKVLFEYPETGSGHEMEDDVGLIPAHWTWKSLFGGVRSPKPSVRRNQTRGRMKS